MWGVCVTSLTQDPHLTGSSFWTQATREQKTAINIQSYNLVYTLLKHKQVLKPRKTRKEDLVQAQRHLGRVMGSIYGTPDRSKWRQEFLFHSVRHPKSSPKKSFSCLASTTHARPNAHGSHVSAKLHSVPAAYQWIRVAIPALLSVCSKSSDN